MDLSSGLFQLQQGILFLLHCPDGFSGQACTHTHSFDFRKSDPAF